jgi:hypothetical protein
MPSVLLPVPHFKQEGPHTGRPACARFAVAPQRASATGFLAAWGEFDFLVAVLEAVAPVAALNDSLIRVPSNLVEGTLSFL